MEVDLTNDGVTTTEPVKEPARDKETGTTPMITDTVTLSEEDDTASTMTPATVTPPTKMHAAGINHLSDHRRKTEKFFDFSFQVQNESLKDLSGTACKQAQAIFKAMKEVDETTIWYLFAPSPNEKGACAIPSKLPSTFNRMDKLLKGFRVQAEKTYTMWVSVRMGFDMDEDEFKINMGAILKAEFNGAIYVKALQHHDGEPIGFIVGAPPMQFHIPSNVAHYAKQFAAFDLRDQRKPPLKFGLRRKKIWKGTKSAKEKSKASYAIHVEVERGQGRRGRAYFMALFKSETFRRRQGIRYRLCPVIRNKGEQAKERRAANNHEKVVASMDHETVHTFSDVDMPNRGILDPTTRQKMTLRQAMLAIRAPDDQPLFLAIERHWSNDGYCVTFPRIYADQARNMLEGIVVYLQHVYKDSPQEVERWFTVEGLDEAENMLWDAVNNRVITEIDRELDEGDEDTQKMFWLDPEVLKELESTPDPIFRPARRMEVDYDMQSLASTGTLGTKADALRLAARFDEAIREEQEAELATTEPSTDNTTRSPTGADGEANLSASDAPFAGALDA
jgi:hypothetical protein